LLPPSQHEFAHQHLLLQAKTRSFAIPLKKNWILLGKNNMKAVPLAYHVDQIEKIKIKQVNTRTTLFKEFSY
jgi:hypothetical protein